MGDAVSYAEVAGQSADKSATVVVVAPAKQQDQQGVEKTATPNSPPPPASPSHEDKVKEEEESPVRFVEAPPPKVNPWTARKGPSIKETKAPPQTLPKEREDAAVVVPRTAAETSDWPTLEATRKDESPPTGAAAPDLDHAKENKVNQDKKRKKDRKEKWVPVDIPFPTKRGGGMKGGRRPPRSSESSNWREDAKGKLFQD